MKPMRIALAVPAVLLLGACASHVNSLSSASPAPAVAHKNDVSRNDAYSLGEPALAPDAVTGATADLGTAGGSGSANSTGVETAVSTKTGAEAPSVISKGQVSLTTKDIAGARFNLQKMLDTFGGTISSEKAESDKHGNTERDRLELRVPSSHFDDAMNKIPTFGTPVDSSRTSEDVTTQIIDNNARVRTQRLSLQRVQALLAQARSINEVIAIESQLSRRQANLDSLEQQQKYLADQTALSTITVYLTTPEKAATPKPKKKHHAFTSGFSSGWDHLGSSTSAILTGLGAVLPFGVVLALVGVPLWLVRRRRTLSLR